MTTGSTDEKSVLDNVFSSSDMGDNSAAPGTSPDTPAPEAKAVAEPKPEEIVKADTVKDDEEPLQGRDPKSGRFVPVTELVAERKKLKGEREHEAKLRMEAEANAKAYKERVEALERQYAQPQQRAVQPQEPQQPIPDPYTDPEGYFAYQQSAINQQFINQKVNTSHMLANAKYGNEKVSSAIEAAQRAGIAHRFQEANEPFEALMAWHNRQVRDAEVGEDLEAFKKRVADDAVAKALANLKATGQPLGQAQTPQRFPGTLADATPTGSQGSVLTDETAVNDVFAKKRSA